MFMYIVCSRFAIFLIFGRGTGSAYPCDDPRDPTKTICDGPSAFPLDQVPDFLAQMKAVNDLVKSLPPLDIT